MKTPEFYSLYKLYQSTIYETFEETIKGLGWHMSGKKYRSNFTKDLATLTLYIRNNNTNEEAIVSFMHFWQELLFMDRDEKPYRFDMKLLDKNYGLAKAVQIAVKKAETLDALYRGDKDKIKAISKIVERIKGSIPVDPHDPTKGSTLIHYEQGIEQPDSGTIIPYGGKHE